MDLRDFHDGLPPELRNEPEYPAAGGEPRAWIQWAEGVMQFHHEAVMDLRRERDRLMREVQALTVDARHAADRAREQDELLAAYKRVNDSNRLRTVHEPGATVYVHGEAAEVEAVVIDRAGVIYALGRVENGRYGEFVVPARHVTADKPEEPLVAPGTMGPAPVIDPRD